MSVTVDKFRTLDYNVFTKQEKITRGVIECLEGKTLNIGDSLPSVNKLSDNLGYGRETVVKAYGILRDRGIVETKHGLGYFIIDESPDRHLSIALVLYGFQNFHQEFYNQFRRQLGNSYKIDVFFHHNNLTMYESILQSINRKYGKYVIAPIQNDKAKSILHTLPEEKLIVIDRFQEIGALASYVTQEFQNSMLDELEKIKEEIFKFDKHFVFYNERADYPPPGILSGLKSFFENNDRILNVCEEFESQHLELNCFYVTVSDTDLWYILKEAKKKGMVVGKDLAIVSRNDSIVKEIIEGGITTFSTNFKKMAEEAANCIQIKSMVKKVIPSELIRRESF